MTQQFPSQAPPKKPAGFWTPWGNVRVPDLDEALEASDPRPVRLPPNAVEPRPLPLLRRD